MNAPPRHASAHRFHGSTLVILFLLLAWPVASGHAQQARRQPPPAAATAAAPADAAADGVHVSQVAPKFYLLSHATANLIVFVGDDLSCVVGIQHPALVKRAIALLASLHAPAVKYALIGDAEDAAAYGDGGWGRRGAVTLAQERLLARMAKETPAPPAGTNGAQTAPATALPVMGFSQVVQLHIKDEDTHIIHERAGYSDADTIIHFEHSGIVYLGPTFTTDGYPRIDAARGGQLAGLIDTADFFATNFAQVPDKVEPIIPGRGPVATLADLRDYRDMLRTVRDRVRTLTQSGKSLQEILAAKPTAEFDSKWGHGPVTPTEFVTMVRASLTP